jgi:galactokinase
MENLVKEASAYFQESFNAAPGHVFLSPGRINIIGEHVDYNNGYVLPAAIDKYVCLAISERIDTQCIIAAKDLDDVYQFDLNDDLVPVEKMWVNYFLGVLHQLKERGLRLRGFSVVFTSTVPIGSGLSSSAAVECGFAYALNDIFSLHIDKKDIALIGQKAEHTFAGVQCGIMDQFASVFGKKNQVIKLDCDTLEYDYHNADFKDYTLLLLDSKVKHTHLTSGYNDRRREVEEGLALIKKQFPEVATFRDCTAAHVDALHDKLGDTVYRRCHFVVSEIQRVLDAVDALEQSDFEKLGALMFETHDGLSTEYDVSCAETDFLVDAVRRDDKVIGARMMGGGFGGCTINLVRKGYEDELTARVAAEYQEKFNIRIEAYKVNISDGTSKYK